MATAPTRSSNQARPGVRLPRGIPNHRPEGRSVRRDDTPVVPDVAGWVGRYARAGMTVLPLHAITAGGGCSCGHTECPSPGKHPRLRPAHDRDDPARATCRGDCGQLGHGVWDATSDLSQVAEWLAAWPDTNWGIAPAEGIVVLDVDPRSGGHQSLTRLLDQHGSLPSTLTARTGGGGWHLWLRHQGPSRGRLAAGIDVKKHGGYVVVPPALHASGGTYRWSSIVAIAPAPRWVAGLLTPSAPTPAAGTSEATGDEVSALERLVRTMERAAEGERNRTLFWAACRAHEEDLDTSALIAAALRVGLSHPEAAATVASAARTTTGGT